MFPSKAYGEDITISDCFEKEEIIVKTGDSIKSADSIFYRVVIQGTEHNTLLFPKNGDIGVESENKISGERTGKYYSNEDFIVDGFEDSIFRMETNVEQDELIKYGEKTISPVTIFILQIDNHSINDDSESSNDSEESSASDKDSMSTDKDGLDKVIGDDKNEHSDSEKEVDDINGEYVVNTQNDSEEDKISGETLDGNNNETSPVGKVSVDIYKHNRHFFISPNKADEINVNISKGNTNPQTGDDGKYKIIVSLLMVAVSTFLLYKVKKYEKSNC